MTHEGLPNYVAAIFVGVVILRPPLQGYLAARVVTTKKDLGPFLVTDTITQHIKSGGAWRADALLPALPPLPSPPLPGARVRTPMTLARMVYPTHIGALCASDAGALIACVRAYISMAASCARALLHTVGERLHMPPTWALHTVLAS